MQNKDELLEDIREDTVVNAIPEKGESVAISAHPHPQTPIAHVTRLEFPYTQRGKGSLDGFPSHAYYTIVL